MKSYQGNPPREDEGWRKVRSCFDAEKIEWRIFAKPQPHTNDWMTFKIVANGRAPRKANYWVIRNITTGQLGYARDFAMMREHRPELHAMIEEVFNEF